jgi:hypothetical protein
MDVTAHKYEVEKAIVQILLTQLDAKQISLSESHEIAEFCLEKLKYIATEEDINNFISQLVMQNVMFKDIATIENAKTKENSDQQAVNRALDLAKEGNLDEALNVAKAATAN